MPGPATGHTSPHGLNPRASGRMAGRKAPPRKVRGPRLQVSGPEPGWPRRECCGPRRLVDEGIATPVLLGTPAELAAAAGRAGIGCLAFLARHEQLNMICIFSPDAILWAYGGCDREKSGRADTEKDSPPTKIPLQHGENHINALGTQWLTTK